jgi:hypothetical protein
VPCCAAIRCCACSRHSSPCGCCALTGWRRQWALCHAARSQQACCTIRVGGQLPPGEVVLWQSHASACSSCHVDATCNRPSWRSRAPTCALLCATTTTTAHARARAVARWRQQLLFWSPALLWRRPAAAWMRMQRQRWPRTRCLTCLALRWGGAVVPQRWCGCARARALLPPTLQQH